jgi:hypothetical protein
MMSLSSKKTPRSKRRYSIVATALIFYDHVLMAVGQEDTLLREEADIRRLEAASGQHEK